MCYRLHAANVTPTDGSRAHPQRRRRHERSVVVPFTARADGSSSGCTTSTAATVNDILANPPGFYVNVHTTEHPAGAIRAQLP